MPYYQMKVLFWSPSVAAAKEVYVESDLSLKGRVEERGGLYQMSGLFNTPRRYVNNVNMKFADMRREYGGANDEYIE